MKLLALFDANKPTLNTSQLAQAAVSHDDSMKGFRWHYDFHKVTLAATAVFAYAWLVPAALYMAMWAKAENNGGDDNNEGTSTPSPTTTNTMITTTVDVWVMTLVYQTT